VKQRLQSAKRIVVKIGSALLVDARTGEVKAQWLSTLIDDLARAKARGADIIIVSSGAIALGRRSLGLPSGKLRLEESQAAAAVGRLHWPRPGLRLAHKKNRGGAGAGNLDRHGRTPSPSQRPRNTTTLLAQGAVPVINENDTVATSEIRYGDNDRLAARVASMMSADCLVLLSDIDGLYSAPPDKAGSTFISEVKEITPEIEAMAGKPVSGLGSGGMVTKIEAGKIALGAGCNMVIASGHESHPLQRIADGERCTWFLAPISALQSRKRWIAGTLQPVGRLIIDDGARTALGQRQEPPARRRQARMWKFCPRRHGKCDDPRRPRDRPWPRGL
jgi:glutamate 5-kinase